MEEKKDPENQELMRSECFSVEERLHEEDDLRMNNCQPVSPSINRNAVEDLVL